jgi:8-oxo-dGTP diphosphatase
MYKGAGVILIDDKGRVLLQYRDKNTSWYPNYWGVFGGQIEEGETPEKAVRREAKEELEIELTDLKFFRRYELKREKGIYEAFIFIAPLNIPVEKLREQQREGEDLGRFSHNELKGLKTTDLTTLVLKDFFKQV